MISCQQYDRFIITKFAPSKKTMALIEEIEAQIKEEPVNTTQEPISNRQTTKVR